MKKYIITEDTLKSVLSYLAGRPYAEVAEGMNVLTKLEELTEPQDQPTWDELKKQGFNPDDPRSIKEQLLPDPRS